MFDSQLNNNSHFYLNDSLLSFHFYLKKGFFCFSSVQNEISKRLMVFLGAFIWMLAYKEKEHRHTIKDAVSF